MTKSNYVFIFQLSHEEMLREKDDEIRQLNERIQQQPMQTQSLVRTVDFTFHYGST